MTQTADTTFQNLSKLKEVQLLLKKELALQYNAKVTPFIAIITTVMKAKNCKEFEAVKYIKENLIIYKQPKAPLFFSAALMEITEANNFSELKK